MCFCEILARHTVLRSRPSIRSWSFSCVSLSAVHLGLIVNGAISFVMFVSLVAKPDESLKIGNYVWEVFRALKPFSNESKIAARKREEFSQKFGARQFLMRRNASNKRVELNASLAHEFDRELVKNAFHVLLWRQWRNETAGMMRLQFFLKDFL